MSGERRLQRGPGRTGGSETGRRGSSAGRPRLGARSPLPGACSPAWLPGRGARVCAPWESQASAFVDRDPLFSAFLLQGNSPQSWVRSGCRAHVAHPAGGLWTAIAGKDLILNPSLRVPPSSLSNSLTQTLRTDPPSPFPATDNSTPEGVAHVPSVSTGKGGPLSWHGSDRAYSIV